VKARAVRGHEHLRIHPWRRLAVLALLVVSGWVSGAYGQSNTRLLLSSGVGVPEHAGFVFGPFSSLSMNEAKQIVFLSSLRGSKSELRAVIRSEGVTFSVVAFDGLRAPVAKAFYESFSAPSLNDGGLVAFTATLKKESEEIPASIVVRVEGTNHLAIARAGDAVPGIPDAAFQEFSAPLVDSAGNVLFAARTGGKRTGPGLFYWTPRGTQSVLVPAELNLLPNDLLEPAFFSHDEAVFVRRGTPADLVMEQFFRAIAIKNYQALNPAPAPSEAVEVLPARSGEAGVNMLLVVMEGEKVETVALTGNPAQAVMVKQPAGIPSKPLGRIQGQTSGARGNIIFASTPSDQPNDLALFCYCDGQVNRLTTPEEFLSITTVGQGKPIVSLAGDARHTTAFIAPSEVEGTSAIYVTSIP